MIVAFSPLAILTMFNSTPDGGRTRRQPPGSDFQMQLARLVLLHRPRHGTRPRGPVQPPAGKQKRASV